MAKIYLKRQYNDSSCDGCYFDTPVKCTKKQRLTKERYSNEDVCGEYIYIEVKRVD